MIIGKGMLARTFSAYHESEEVIIFASGVSNSTEKGAAHFHREKELLETTIANHPHATFVYFGTCSVDDPELSHCSYVQHKIAMENLIEKSCQHYFIFRLSQVVGRTQSPTLINFIVEKIKNNELFHIWKNSTRNLIDVDDVFKIADYFIKNSIFENQITNIAAPSSLSIFTIVDIIEKLSDFKGRYILENRGGSYNIDIKKIYPYLEKAGVSFFDMYPLFIIEKYFFKK